MVYFVIKVMEIIVIRLMEAIAQLLTILIQLYQFNVQ